MGEHDVESRGLEAGASAPSVCPFNELGKIAESYDVLHSISKLQSARKLPAIPRVSHNSAVQAVFQGAEVAFLNMKRLTDLASCQVARSQPARALVYVRWLSGFHAILRRLGVAATTLQMHRHESGSALAPAAETGSEPKAMSLKHSKALNGYVEATTGLEGLLVRHLTGQSSDSLRGLIGRSTHDDVMYSLLHMMRLNAHDGTKWESDLHSVPVDEGMPEYGLAIGEDLLQAAVEESTLTGARDSFYGQFVALHQIPELLCDEVNDHVERAIREFRDDNLSTAVEQLAISRALLGPVVESQRVMVECLATSEYHRFRENLGPASGIHSLAIRQHMFRDLFTSLWNELEAKISAKGSVSLDEAAHTITKHRHQRSDAWLKHALMNEAFGLHHLHEEWRHEHLHMPRNCLGSGGTKSMIGVHDGLQVVMKMRDAANAHPSLKRMHRARAMRLGSVESDGLLTKHHKADSSLDTMLRRLTGEVTRDYFPEVQEKEFFQFKFQVPERKP